MAHPSLPKLVRAAARAYSDPSEDTADRIRAYLASVCPLSGCDVSAARTYTGADDYYQRGRSLIERLALSARGTHDPTLQLTATQAADVLYFIHNSEPIAPRTWWVD